LGSPRGGPRACFRALLVVAPGQPSTRRVTAWLQPSFPYRLSRAPSHPSSLDDFRSRANAARVSCPLRDITGARPLETGIPTPLGSVLRRSQPLDGFLRAPAPGLLSSPSRVQDTRTVQGLLSSRSRTDSSSADAPLPLSPSRSPGVTAWRPHDKRLGFEALLHARARSLRRGYAPRRRPLPSSVSAPPGPPPPGRARFRALLRSCRWGTRSSLARWPSTFSSSVSPRTARRLCLQKAPTRTSFWPAVGFRSKRAQKLAPE
jgi:hypothetical protein